MWSVFLAFTIVLASASAAHSGAWLREKGKGFIATSISSSEERDTSGSAYLEYGLTNSRTIGLDVSYGFELTGKEDGSGIAFLRFPLGPTDQIDRFAWHAGIGTRYQNREFYPAVEAGASWGRGIKWGENWGWVNVDTSVNQSRSPIERRIKLDGTIGMPLNDHFKAMGQLFNTFEGGETYTKLAPSLLIAPKKSKTTWQLSMEIPVVGGGDTFFKFGIWSDF